MVESLEAQDHPALDVIAVADDSGGRPDALNRGAREATGTYLIFLEERAVAEPAFVSSLVRVAEHTGADVVTSASRWSVGAAEGIRPPEGGPPVAGLFYRCFGDGGYLIRREAFEASGASTPRSSRTEDHHLLCRAALEGRRIETVPEPLIRERIPKENAGDAIHARGEATLRAYQQRALDGLSELPQIAQAQWSLSGSKDAQIKGILESRSWRITTPLRWVTAKLGRRARRRAERAACRPAVSARRRNVGWVGGPPCHRIAGTILDWAPHIGALCRMLGLAAREPARLPSRCYARVIPPAKKAGWRSRSVASAPSSDMFVRLIIEPADAR